jgi:signal transduction histidine kinase
LIKQILQDTQSDILEAGHTVVQRNKSRSLFAFADIHSTRMIVENLLSNAIKYTPSGGRITVTIKRQNNFVIFSIEDTGVGIDKHDYPKLFKQFSRIPNELTKQTTGSGIGLYIAQYLANANGGKIEVDSKKGKGSVFTLLLPTRSVKKFTVPKRKKAVD